MCFKITGSRAFPAIASSPLQWLDCGGEGVGRRSDQEEGRRQPICEGWKLQADKQASRRAPSQAPSGDVSQAQNGHRDMLFKLVSKGLLIYCATLPTPHTNCSAMSAPCSFSSTPLHLRF